ncbi:MAG: site-specific integrase [Candidatus Acidulodesulfobacterium acidiphilum]|uniref:Site-specific integrase n=1 Tax=Candidatus Acidulodesulfobacterium acidiphilum TaxID=2597224 RepID=A0A520XDE2_9DELT|nr:MAG: site-specific integrase [Candidatus Acidulodesulfobacterium acidiphilum]
MDNNQIAIYAETPITKNGKKTEFIETDLKTNNYYENDNIVFFTASQIKTLTDGIDNPFHKLVILLLYETGARIEEARTLKFSDIDTGNGRVKVLTLKQRKKNKIYRYLKISDKLLSLILNHRVTAKLTDDDFILSQRQGKPAITRKGISLMFKSYVVKLLGQSNLDKAHPHALRHTRAVHLLDSGMNIMLLKNFLGHASISNTLIYLKYSNKDMAEAISRANNGL